MKRSSQELLELMKSSNDYNEYMIKSKEDVNKGRMKISAALNSVLAEKELNKSTVIAKSGIENHYAYQIFSGVKNPTRDKVLMLSVGLGLDGEETQRLLKVTGYAQLYVKDERDGIILFGLTKRLTVIEINDLLYDMGHAILE